MSREELNTHEAFARLVESPYYWKLTGGSTNLRHQFASMLKNNKGITLDKKEEWLTKAGFLIQQEKIWNLPKGA